MIKEALQYIVGLSEAKTQNINGNVYSDKPLHRIDTYFPAADPIRVNNLSSLLEYIHSGVDTMADKMIIQVVSPTKVVLFSQLNDNRDRETLVIAEAQIPSFNYERFIEHESFCIGVQSKFVDDLETDKSLILKFAGTVEAGTVAQYGDDGISQKATIKIGIASKSEAIVPNPVKLRPYRTFSEVEQPVSDFIFRMNQTSGVSCAIFEADGGAWKNAAMNNIYRYLVDFLPESDRFIVIS